MPDSSKAPRIAISFGGSSASKTHSSNKKSSRPDPPSSLGKRSRTNALNHGFDSGSEGEHDSRGGRRETITEFGGEKEVKGKPRELVIEKQSNRDWKTELRARRRGGNGQLPAEAQAQAQAQAEEQRKNGKQPPETDPADADMQIQWGLTVKKRKTSEESSTDDEDGERRGERRRRREKSTQNERSADREDDKQATTRTADEEAMDALLGKKRPEEDMVIHPTEEDAYLADMKHVGEDSTLADYEAIPDGEFGAALLRGMGWDGKMRGPDKKRPMERRQNQLGLGAKKLEGAEDLGQWNHGGKKKSSRPPRLDEYRRGEEKRRAERRERRGESYRDDRDREERDRHSQYDRDGDWDRDRDRDYYGSRHRGGDSRR